MNNENYHLGGGNMEDIILVGQTAQVNDRLLRLEIVHITDVVNVDNKDHSAFGVQNSILENDDTK